MAGRGDGEKGEGRFLQGTMSSMPLFSKGIVAKVVAVGVATTAVAPLDRVKILFQTGRTEFQSVGLWGSFKKIAKMEGLRGFYKGNGADIARMLPLMALHSMAYTEVGRGPVLIAGGTVLLCTYPLDLVRTKLAYQVVESPRFNFAGQLQAEPIYKGVSDCVSKIYRERGIKGLFRGAAPFLLHFHSFLGLKIYFYEDMKSRFHGVHNDAMLNLACGSIAISLAHTVTYPLEVVKCQMQVQDLSAAARGEVRGTFQTLVMIARKQGWRQLFSGWSIYYLKAVPLRAVALCVIIAMQPWLTVPGDAD